MTLPLSAPGEREAGPVRVQLSRAMNETSDCRICQGNGEIVTDWDRYLHARPGDKGDEAVADCTACDGTGQVDTPASPPGPIGKQQEETRS